MLIEPLEERDLDDAARLATIRHARVRQRYAFLPDDFENLAEMRGQLKALLSEPQTAGVIARDSGRIVGFAIGKADAAIAGSLMARFMEERTGAIGLGSHGVADGVDAFAVYSALYAELARDWVANGFFAHSCHLYETDREAHEALVNLGFGRKMVTAFARVEQPSPQLSAGLDIRQVGVEEMAAVMQLDHELTAYHTEPPILMACDPLTDAETMAFQESLIAEEDNAHFVAWLDGKPAGLMTFQNPPLFLGPQFRGERVVYLYQGVVASEARAGGVGEALMRRGMEWMADQGFEYCGLHYHAANRTGGPFWRRHGFAAVEYAMVRIVDSRIGWARTW
jgi:ribosomal protein S18 acetylase RimI-like enzyme